ncbi:MAG: DUF134 domain-containing protein [Erysipelotrichaceae bacterium]|nr:DUF134 domain-containing protein [Erysipelotrichaceae bacterium]
MPEFTAFKTCKNPDNEKVIVMSVEEYECIRLIDYEGMTQQECAEVLNVGRTTVQRMYDVARNKIAIYLVEGAMLNVAGGNYQITKGCQRRQKGHRLNRCPKINQED